MSTCWCQRADVNVLTSTCRYCSFISTFVFHFLHVWYMPIKISFIKSIISTLESKRDIKETGGPIRAKALEKAPSDGKPIELSSLSILSGWCRFQSLMKSSLVYCHQQRWALITVPGLNPCAQAFRMFLNGKLSNLNVNPKWKTCHNLSPFWESVQEESVPCGRCVLSSETLQIARMCPLLLVTMLSPLECLQSGTGKLCLSGMNAPEQSFTSYRWDLPQRLLKSVSIYLGEIWDMLLSVSPNFPIRFDAYVDYYSSVIDPVLASFPSFSCLSTHLSVFLGWQFSDELTS